MSKNKSGNKQGKNVAMRGKPKAPSPVLLRTDTLGLFIDKYAFAIVSGLLVLIALIVFKDFIFLKKVLLYKDIGSDTLNGAYPILKHTADYIHKEGLPKWSFNYGMGQNIFPFFLRDPFDLVLYIAGKDQLAYGLGYVEFVKVIITGMIFYLYLRTFSFNSFTCIVGSLLYAFSGFMILGGTWYIFSYEGLTAALLLLAFEKLFKKNSWYLFPIAIALIGTSMPFNLYVYGLFLAVYGTFRFVVEKGADIKGLALLYAKLILLGVLGVGLSSFFVFANALQLLESPRGSGESSYFNLLSSAPMFAFGNLVHNLTAIMRLFSNDIMGTGTNFKGWTNYLEAPMFYSGLLSLLLCPLVFQFLDRRKKIIYGIFIAIWILPVIFPYFRYAFWLFTGDYYRAFSFFVSFTTLFFGLNALNKIITTYSIKLPQLAGSLFVLLGILLYFNSSASDINQSIFNSDLMSLTKVLLVTYAVLIYLISNRSFSSYAKVILIILLCFELGYFSSITVNKRSAVTSQEWEGKTGYNDYSVDAVSFLKQTDRSFYRVDKNYSSGPAMHASINDGLVQDYYGTSSYHSFNQNYYIKFLKALGVVRKDVENDTRWAAGLSQKPLAEIIGNVKYFFSKQENWPFCYDSIAQFGDVKILKNKYYLPLGFTYEKYLLRSDFDKMSAQQRDFILLKTFFIEEGEKNNYSDFESFALKDTAANYTWNDVAHDVGILKKDTLAVVDFGQNFLRGKITLDKKKLLFLSIPFDKGWTATVDGKRQEMKIVDAGMSGLILDKGVHTIEMEFNPPLVKSGLMVSLSSILIYAFLIFWKRNKKEKVE